MPPVDPKRIGGIYRKIAIKKIKNQRTKNKKNDAAASKRRKNKMIVREEKLIDINDQGQEYERNIPIRLKENNKVYEIEVDGVNWIKLENRVHAVVLFEMMRENLTDYMTYKEI